MRSASHGEDERAFAAWANPSRVKIISLHDLYIIAGWYVESYLSGLSTILGGLY